MCVSWDLSRTYPTSLSRNWYTSLCPRFFPALGRVVQVTWCGHRGIFSVPGRIRDLRPRTDWCRWTILSPISQPFPWGSDILPFLAFPEQERSEYCRHLRTSACRGQSVGQGRRRRTPLPKEEEGPLPSSGSGERAPAANENDPALRHARGLPPRLPNSNANIAVMRATGDDEDGHWRNDFEPEEHPGLRNPPRHFQPAMKRWPLGLRGRRKMDWGCLPSGIRPAPQPARRPRVSPPAAL